MTFIRLLSFNQFRLCRHPPFSLSQSLSQRRQCSAAIYCRHIDFRYFVNESNSLAWSATRNAQYTNSVPHITGGSSISHWCMWRRMRQCHYDGPCIILGPDGDFSCCEQKPREQTGRITMWYRKRLRDNNEVRYINFNSSALTFFGH